MTGWGVLAWAFDHLPKSWQKALQDVGKSIGQNTSDD